MRRLNASQKRFKQLNGELRRRDAVAGKVGQVHQEDHDASDCHALQHVHGGRKDIRRGLGLETVHAVNEKGEDALERGVVERQLGRAVGVGVARVGRRGVQVQHVDQAPSPQRANLLGL